MFSVRIASRANGAPTLTAGCLSSIRTSIYENPRYIKLVDKHGGRAPPESRLPQGMVGAVLLVVGLIWFAATDGPSVHWIVPILAGVPFACGMVRDIVEWSIPRIWYHTDARLAFQLFVFLALMNYLIDCKRSLCSLKSRARQAVDDVSLPRFNPSRLRRVRRECACRQFCFTKSVWCW